MTVDKCGRMVPVSYNSVVVGGGGACEALLPLVLDPIFAVTPSSSLKRNTSSSSSSVSLLFKSSRSIITCSSISRRRNRRSDYSMANNLRTENYLRHVDSRRIMPSGAGHIPHLNAVILGESLASEEDDYVLPSKEFADQANVQSPEQVNLRCIFRMFFWVFY